MRKFLLALMLTFAFSSMAQNKVYCELSGYCKSLSQKINVTIDFGQSTSLWAGYTNQYIVDQNGKPKEFNSMIDAMNFMAKLGWNFEQAYVLQEGNSNDIHWILSKDITNDEEFKKGFITKDEYQKNNRK